MRVVTLCGSLGPTSSNQAALDLAAAHVTSASSVAVESAGCLSAVPPFRPDEVDDPPEAVERLRRTLGAADGVLVAAPEYAAGVSGVVKNALDWMVGAGSLYHTPVAVLSAGTTGGPFAIEQLVRTLSWHGALVVSTLGIAAPIPKMHDGRFVDPATIGAIGYWAGALVDAIGESWQAKIERVTRVIVPYWIDPRRFGDG